MASTNILPNIDADVSALSTELTAEEAGTAEENNVEICGVMLISA